MESRKKGASALRIWRAVDFVWKGSSKWTLINAGLVLVQGVLPLASLYLIKLIIDFVTISATHSHRAAMFPHLLGLVVLAGLVTLLSAMLRSLSTLAGEVQAQQVTDWMQGILHAKSVDADLEFYENPSSYDTLHRAQEEAPSRPTRVVSSLMQISQNTVSLVAMAGLLLYALHWTFVLVLIVAAVPGLLVKLRFTSAIFQLRRRQTATERQVVFLNYLLTAEHFAKEIRLFLLGDFFISRARGLRRDLRHQRFQIAKRRSAGELITQVCATLAVFGSFGFLAYRTLEGALTVGAMIMYYQAFQRGQSALQDLLAGATDLYENNLFLANLYEFLDLKPQVASPLHPRPVPAPLKQGIIFEQVGFTYGNGSVVLDDISFHLKPGETLALVGENGSGKTTLIKLLCRLYDPSRGRILVDGIDVREMELEAWRREVSVVFQDYVHYPMTARENIWLGDATLAPGDERVEAAARRSGAHETIEALKYGYETMLGNTFNDGAELSIGQWQKIALARAFLRQAQVIVLDEPTSALDAQAEADVFEQFHELARGRTAVLISHRLATVKMADQILVLEKGHIIETGTHASLMERGGAYRRMYMLQASQYASGSSPASSTPFLADSLSYSATEAEVPEEKVVTL